MRGLDFSSWQAVLTTLFGLVVITLIGVGVRLIVMQTIQQRRERENRQINERLRLLIAAYKTLGGSFTGDLAVDPTHLRSLDAPGPANAVDAGENGAPVTPGSQRRRRVRDAVEAALSDVILLGTADQVQLAVEIANDLVAGRKVETGRLVVLLRANIRQALDLEPLPNLAVPQQGPSRNVSSGGRSGVKEKAGASGGGGGGSGGAGGSGDAALVTAPGADKWPSA